MTYRDLEAVLIVAICAAIVYLNFSSLARRGIGRNRWYYWSRVVAISGVLWVGLLYTLSALKLTPIVFGTATNTMDYFRGGILYLLVTILIDSVWRYRSAGG